ncbi:MAG: hypothetical protein RLZZ546_3318, partial [Bacteroidota bacterium]
MYFNIKTRMKFIIYIFSITLVFFIFSCKFDSKKIDQSIQTHANNALIMDSLKIEGNKVKFGEDSIKTYVKIDFPIQIGNNTLSDKAMQDYLVKNQIDIIKTLLESQNLNSNFDLKKISQMLIDENKGDGRYISYDGNIDTIYMGKEVASFNSSAFYFQGGAHPNTTVNLLNFDKKNVQI